MSDDDAPKPCIPVECPDPIEVDFEFIGRTPEPGPFAREAAAFYGDGFARMVVGDFHSTSVKADGSIERNDNGVITTGPPPIIAVFRTEEDQENFAYTMMGDPILRVGGRCDDGSHAGQEMCAYVIEELWAAGKTAIGDTLEVGTEAGLTIVATVTEEVPVDDPRAQAFQAMAFAQTCRLVTLAVIR